MKLTSPSLSTSSLQLFNRLGRFRVLLFLLLVAGLYGYLVLQVGQALSVQPAPVDQLTTIKPSPKIDENTVKQLKQLQDNSVTVKALFNEGRSNPFQ